MMDELFYFDLYLKSDTKFAKFGCSLLHFEPLPWSIVMLCFYFTIVWIRYFAHSHISDTLHKFDTSMNVYRAVQIVLG